jgi:hypothetical protein
MAWLRRAHKREAGEPGKGEVAAGAVAVQSPAEGARAARSAVPAAARTPGWSAAPAAAAPAAAAPARPRALRALLAWLRRGDQLAAKPSLEDEMLAAARARAGKARGARPWCANSSSCCLCVECGGGSSGGGGSTITGSGGASSTRTGTGNCICTCNCTSTSTGTGSTGTGTSFAAWSKAGVGEGQARAAAVQASAEAPLIDPVLLDAIQPGEATFAFLRPHCGKAVVYRVESLVDYFLASGRFQEPETGLRFSEQQLAALDMLAHESGIRRPSVLAASRDLRTYEERTFKDTALLGLERCCGELVGRLPAMLESSRSKDATQLALLTDLFPALRYYYAQLLEADVEFAAQSLAQWARFIEGPPNCPLRCSDPHNLLPAVKDMFYELAGLSLQRATSMA